MNTCNCYECLKDILDSESGLPITAFMMILCPQCGNKRCPRATDHRLECTDSNEPDQLGSTYGVYPHPYIELIEFINKDKNSDRNNN